MLIYLDMSYIVAGSVLKYGVRDLIMVKNEEW